MRKCFFVLFVCPLLGWAQSDYVNVQLDVQEGLYSYPPCEPSISINPKDPSNIVAGAILDRIYTSFDGGLSWQKQTLKSSLGVFGDPCILSSPKGDFYYLHLSDPSGKGWSSPELLDRIVCQRSRDGGLSWNDGGSIGLNGAKDQDKEWAVVDEKTGAIYCTWTQFDKYDSSSPKDRSNIMFSLSNKRAKRWSEPVRINSASGDCLDSDMTVEGAVPAIGNHGELYVSWALGDVIYFDYSLDNGKSWLDNDIVAGNIVGGWDINVAGIQRCNGMPVTAVDVSESEYSGNIYINYVDTFNGEDDPDVWLLVSEDGGTSWSEPIRVNDDATGNDQFFTWMTVDPVSGAIYCVFYDRRNYGDTRTDVYLATSIDGGKSFVNERISEAPFTPNKSFFIGDYNNIDAYDGFVRPIWTRMNENGQTSVWTAIIDKR